MSEGHSDKSQLLIGFDSVFVECSTLNNHQIWQIFGGKNEENPCSIYVQPPLRCSIIEFPKPENNLNFRFLVKNNSITSTTLQRAHFFARSCSMAKLHSGSGLNANLVLAVVVIFITPPQFFTCAFYYILMSLKDKKQNCYWTSGVL